MNMEHLSDEAIQRYVLNDEAPVNLAAHISTCLLCSTKVAQYRAIVGGLSTQPIAQFNFNANALIPADIRRRRHFPWFTLLVGVAILMGFAIIMVGFASAITFKINPLLPGTALLILIATAISIILQHYRSWRLLSI